MAKKYLQDIGLKVSSIKFMSASEYLLAVYQALRDHVPRYSYERFSDDLGLGASNVAYLLAHGKRPITDRSARAIIKALHLKNLDRRYFLQLVAAQKITAAPDLSETFEKLVDLKTKALAKSIDRRFLEFYNHWYNIAILALLDLPDAKDDVEWLSGQLRPPVPPSKVAKSINLLKKLGYIVYSEDKKRLVPSEKVVDTGPEVLGLAIVRYHQQMIGLASDAVTQIAAEEREISAITISVSHQDLPLIKEKVRAFQNELLSLSQGQKASDTVTQVNIQVFPVTRTTSQRG
jgi:uncharacterized protein (TIGR02147 family)